MLVLLTTIVLTALPVLIGVLRFLRNRNWRALIQGIGIGLIPLGLYFLGLMQLAVNGVFSIVAWIERTPWTPVMTNASILTGVGIVMFVVGGFLSSGRPVEAATPGQTPAVPGARPTPVLPPKGKKPALDPEDAEIEALLRNRGIE